ncbi:RusA family crossover junction endodeoxyribonuclease [Aminobacter aganoensis]|uniref:Crossover junction endodeoxyribonuclease RusA n=1 Tax=Aminobacter aganoensis TaxID=83264 RepID=A0A7X0KJY4_9HYPH|nr:RusA family crossover junction endodeoxyribonuclease [Aminobacter aganoensis]MBB6353505.1 crossover junction endodeoxyribonuclease RusA [Aminobacter aganoensis]
MTRVELPFPVPLHDCFTNVKGRGRVPTPRYKAYGREAWAVIAQQRPNKLKGQVSVYVRLVAPDKRARDADNLGKCILDTLKANGLIEDDSNHFVRKLSFEWAEDGPGCVVLIQQTEQGIAA